MKTYFFAFCLLVPTVSLAQNNAPRASGAAWIDLFGGPDGAVVYPQYSWGVKTSAGKFGGYGFVEAAPHEPFFTNHLVIYSPIRQLSVHTETGGIPRRGLSFFQVGPRVNIHETIPVLKKPLDHFFVTALPHLHGIRPDNLLVAAATNRFEVAPGLQLSLDGYRRFFGKNVPDYSEYWLLFHPEKTKPVSFATFVLHDGDYATVAFGIRIEMPE